MGSQNMINGYKWDLFCISFWDPIYHKNFKQYFMQFLAGIQNYNVLQLSDMLMTIS